MKNVSSPQIMLWHINYYRNLILISELVVWVQHKIYKPLLQPHTNGKQKTKLPSIKTHCNNSSQF